MKDTNKEKAVFRAVYKATKVTRARITKRPGYGHASKLMHVTKYLLRKHTELTHKEIADMFGYKAHATTIYSVQLVQDLIGFDDELTKKINRIEQYILEGNNRDTKEHTR